MYDNNVNSIDAIHASVLLECIHMRDNTSQCNSLNYEEANDIIDYIAVPLERQMHCSLFYFVLCAVASPGGRECFIMCDRLTRG